MEYLEKRGTDFSRLILAGTWPIKSEIDPRPLLEAIALRRAFSLTAIYKMPTIDKIPKAYKVTA